MLINLGENKILRQKTRMLFLEEKTPKYEYPKN